MDEYEITQKFLLVWDMYGIEAIIDLTLEMQDEVEYRLKDTSCDPKNYCNTIDFWMLRARFNPHRNYEIYAITVPEDITREKLAEWFNESPQALADLIRDKGVKLYGLRNNMKPVII
jgi:hypothetical protein